MDLPRLHRDGDVPLVDQLVEHFQVGIESGRLRAGERLPPIRQVASRANVTRSTVQDAYRRLQSAGLVDATVGRGTVVTGTQRDEPVVSPGARAALAHLLQPPAPAEVQGEQVANLAELRPDPSRFPVEAFRASLESALTRRGAALLGYGQPAGDLALRRILATKTPGVGSADPDEILVTNGAQQGIDLVLRTFTRPGDAVAVAVPTYHHLFGLFAAHDVRLVPLAEGATGLDVEELREVLGRGDVRLLYLMPTFHNPTGRTMGLAERAALMRVLAETRVPVLEDEFELDVRFRGDTLPSLRSMDPRDLTVTVRTFSKGLFPGVRIGWVHAPREVLGPMAALKRYTDLESSPLLQAALVDFLQSGAVADYLAELVAELRARHEAAQVALADAMPEGFTWTRPDGGFVVWIEGPEGFDGEALCRLAATKGVAASPGRLFYPDDRPVPAVRLSLSQADAEQVDAGIRILARCAEQLSSGSPAERPLIL